MMKPGDLVSIWQWKKKAQEYALLIDSKETTLGRKWKVLTSDSKLVEMWDVDIYTPDEVIEIQAPSPNSGRRCYPAAERILQPLIATNVEILPMTITPLQYHYLERVQDSNLREED